MVHVEEAMPAKPEKAPIRPMKVALGCFLVLFSSLTFLTAKYAIKIFEINPNDSLFLSGVLQCIIFGVVVACARKESPTAWAQNKDGSINMTMVWTMLAFVLSYGGMYLGILIGARYIHITLVTVLVTLAPITSLLLGRIWAKIQVTRFKISLCLTLLIGVILVVEPQMEASRHSHHYTQQEYIFGVSGCTIFVILNSIVLIAPLKMPKVPVNVLTFYSSFGSSLVPAVFALFVGGSEIYEELTILSLNRWLLLTGVGLCLVVTAWLIFMSLKLGTPPYIVSMIRRLDIIIVLVLDCLYFDLRPVALQWVGAAIAFLSITLINFADVIADYFFKKKK